MRLLIEARNRTIGVEDGLIVRAEGAFDVELRFPDADVRPGLINAHDHLHRNHYGRLGRPPYRNARDWALDIQTRYAARIERGRRKARRSALLAGAWKNLFAGVTTVVHHDPWEPAFEHEFPINVLRIPNADSVGMDGRVERLCGEDRFCLHLAEGIDRESSREVGTLAEMGLLTSGLVAVHGVGMRESDIGRFRAAGAALVWCPTSNRFLFGRTAPAALLEPGMDVLLGSDSLLTGVGDLLDELRHARLLGLIDDERLENAVGAAAARRLGVAPPTLDPGSPADLILLMRPLLQADADDVLLVMVAGRPRVARPDIVPRLNGIAAGGSAIKVGSRTRWIRTERRQDGPNGRRL